MIRIQNYLFKVLKYFSEAYINFESSGLLLELNQNKITSAPPEVAAPAVDKCGSNREDIGFYSAFARTGALKTEYRSSVIKFITYTNIKQIYT